MKLNFKKISAVLGAIVMTGATLGFAAAASYPAPFVQSGSPSVAIVYGTGAGVSSLDMVQAGNIQSSLAGYVTGGTPTGGESYKFEKTSTKFHLGDTYQTIITNLGDDQLPVLLGDGKYMDNDNDEIDYTQKVVIGAHQLTMFDDDNYMEDSPTVGFKISSGTDVLTYQIDFSDTLDISDMPTTNLPMMGKTYYVLSNTSTTLTLLDSAASQTLNAGDIVTLDVDGVSYTITASIFDTANSKVKLEVNGETTNLLGAGETQRLSDGAYVGIKEVIVQNFQGGVNQVEFSIGKGKLVLTDGGSTEVKINDVAVSGLTSDFQITTAPTISRINVTWNTDEDLYITENSSIEMPGFGILKLSYGGLTYPTTEVIEVQQGGTTYAVLNDFPLNDGEADINFLYGDSTSFTGLGKDASNRLLTDANSDGNITFNDSSHDDYFIVSWTDTRDAESYLMRFTNIANDGTYNRTDLQYYKDGAWVNKKEGMKTGDTVQINNVDLTIGRVSTSLGGNSKTVDVWNSSVNTATSIQSFNTLYSAEGLTVYLPWQNSTAVNNTNTTVLTATTACALIPARLGQVYTGTMYYNNSATVAGEASTAACATTFPLMMVEEDRSGNKYAGDDFNVTIGWDTSTTKEVEVSDLVGEEATLAEIGDTDVWRSFMYSALATEFLWSKPDSGQNSIVINYHGDEVAANAYITSPDTTIGGTLGNVLVMDSEVSSVSDKNLVIVGGSCINSAAATALGVSEHTCGAAFTAATGVGAGQFLIKGVADAFTTGKLALVVAGYEADDTTNAATYLVNQPVDTSKEYKGTSGTSAELIVE
ncbi:MAG: hypothetical protein KKB62_03600 [Nanoarchaeota archaeon]|nr:hypothetical protein [Nanoarchaeota archaeon]